MWPWVQSPLGMCSCDTKQAQGFPTHQNKAQPLDKAMTDQSISTTTPGPAVPQDRVLLPTICSPHQGNHSQPQPRIALLGLSSPQFPQDLKSPSRSLEAQRFFSSLAHSTHGGVKAIPRAAPHRHTLGAQSTAVNAGAASVGLDLRVL